MFPLNFENAFRDASDVTMSPCLSRLSRDAKPETMRLSLSTFANGRESLTESPSVSQWALDIVILVYIIEPFLHKC